MEAIKIAVTGSTAQVIREYPVTAGAVGIAVEFSFDGSWDSLQKTAVFRAGGRTLDCLIKDSAATVPWELTQRAGCMLYCGVYGCSSDGALQIPTIWAELGEILPGADPAGDASADPTLPVWQQLTADVEQALDAIIRLQEQIINDKIASVGEEAEL